MILFILNLVSSAPTSDKVSGLPQTQNFNITFQIYAGYLPISDQKSLFYYFTTSKSNPKTDPLMLWLDGGPGCSSLQGGFMLNGPFVVDQTQALLSQNLYSWNSQASMLYISSPAGAGFSLRGNSTYTNDNITAVDNLQALIVWFSKFPEYSNHQFYIGGTSYAGIYVPMLAYQILKYNEKKTQKIDLKGILVGNAATDWTVDADNAWPYFLWEHGLIGQDLYKKWTENYCTGNPVTDPYCKEIFDQMAKTFSIVNFWDIYRPCIYSEKKYGWGDPPVASCAPDTGIFQYINKPEVRKALHASSEVGLWKQCNHDLNYEILYSTGGSLYLYPFLIENGLRIRVFSGDTDSCLPTCGTRQWIHKLDMKVKSDWRSYSINGQVAGYFEVYEPDFTFMTVKGSGHMCVQWNRPLGLMLQTTFLKGTTPN